MKKNLKIPYLLIGGRLSIHFLKLFSQAMAMAIHNLSTPYFNVRQSLFLFFSLQKSTDCFSHWPVINVTDLQFLTRMDAYFYFSSFFQEIAKTLFKGLQ